MEGLIATETLEEMFVVSMTPLNKLALLDNWPSASTMNKYSFWTYIWYFSI